MAHKRQPRPDFGLGCQAKVLQTFLGVPVWDAGGGSESTRWTVILPSKVNLPHIICFRALCGSNLVALRSKFEDNGTLEDHRVARVEGLGVGGKEHLSCIEETKTMIETQEMNVSDFVGKLPGNGDGGCSYY